MVLSPTAKKARYLHQHYLHGLPANNVPAYHSPLLPTLPPLPWQPAAPHLQSFFLGRGLVCSVLRLSFL